MQEFEPKLKKDVFTRQFFSKYIYVLIIGLCLLLGVSYSLTFFIQNKSVATGSITTGALTVSFTDKSINATGLTVPNTDQEGINEYVKSITITNITNIDGIVKLTLTRTSGLALTDMKYALLVNGIIQEIDNLPGNGEIFETGILGGSPTGESINIEIRLWPKTAYTGDATTFVGSIETSVNYLGQKASSLANLTGKYVNFNCDGSTCEVWQIVKVEDGRLVLTKQANYEGATNRTNSNKYNPNSFNPAITFNDDSLITSLSTDGLNVYLAKTVKINGGSGTQISPYTLENNVLREPDKKIIATITYMNGTTNLGTQKIYYNETNYISQAPSTFGFTYWSNASNNYYLGDTVNFTEDTILTAIKVMANELDFDNTVTGFDCTDIQCVLEALNDRLY